MFDAGILDNREAMKELDPQGMTDLIETLPDQWRQATRIARESDLSALKTPKQVVVLGMGGSAIGGDLIRALLEPYAPIPVFVNRAYSIPAFVGPDTLVIASSYSGNTEETLTACDAAVKKGAQIAAVTSGGKLEELAETSNWPMVKIPGGLSPRAAIGFSFVPLLVMMERIGLTSAAEALDETADLLQSLKDRYGVDVPLERNRAKQLAWSLMGRLPLIYGSQGFCGVAAYRWKCQFNENSKAPALHNAFPELNHNETVGLEGLAHVAKDSWLIVLRDTPEDARIKSRVTVTNEIAAKYVSGVTQFRAEGKSDVARLFSLIYPGDYVSLYLALLYGVDPTPIRVIDYLKQRLAQRSSGDA